MGARHEGGSVARHLRFKYEASMCALQRQNAENMKQIFPEKEYLGLSPFPHSCVFERIIYSYSHDGSACSAGGNTYVD